MALVYEDLSVVYAALERPCEADDMREKAEELNEIRQAFYDQDEDEGRGEDGWAEKNEKKEGCIDDATDEEREHEQVIVNAVLVEAPTEVEMVLVQPGSLQKQNDKENVHSVAVSVSPLKSGGDDSRKERGTTPLLRVRAKSRGLSPRDTNSQSQ